MRIRNTLQGSSIAPRLLGAVSSIQQDRMAASHDALGPAEWLTDVIGYFGLVIEATTRSVLIGPTVEHGPERAKKVTTGTVQPRKQKVLQTPPCKWNWISYVLLDLLLVNIYIYNVCICANIDLSGLY